VLEFILRELRMPLYRVGAPAELAIAQCVRQEAAEFFEDVMERGDRLLRREAGELTEGEARDQALLEERAEMEI
jgi:hypothetical protein